MDTMTWRKLQVVQQVKPSPSPPINSNAFHCDVSVPSALFWHPIMCFLGARNDRFLCGHCCRYLNKEPFLDLSWPQDWLLSGFVTTTPKKNRKIKKEQQIIIKCSSVFVQFLQIALMAKRASMATVSSYQGVMKRFCHKHWPCFEEGRSFFFFTAVPFGVSVFIQNLKRLSYRTEDDHMWQSCSWLKCWLSVCCCFSTAILINIV